MAELKTSYDEHYALIIGINKYQNLDNLEYAVNDANAIKDILIKKFNYKEDNIITLLDEEATKQNIMDAYYKISQEVCNDDSVLVFYAGHGSTYQAGLNDRGYLVPTDGTEAKLNSLISWNTLVDEAELFRAKHIFYIMDACYSGLALVRSNGGSKRFLKDMLRRYSRKILTAGKSDQKVKDAGGKTKNSIFTSYLLEALNGAAKTEDGVLCASSIMHYVYNKVANDSRSNQTPGCGTLDGEGDFIFNYDEIEEKISSENEKDKDILIEVPRDPQLKFADNKNDFINNLKELLADSKNYIKITDLINQEIKIYLAESNISKFNLNDNTPDNLKEIILKRQKAASNLISASCLLTYYGNEQYINLVSKIILKTYPSGNYNGYQNAISAIYYPSLLLFQTVLITALEANNIKMIKEILNLKNDKFKESYYKNNEYLIIHLFYKLSNITIYFDMFFPEQKYKFPMNEYIYKQLQPTLEDILYLGDEYEDKYTMAEFLISITHAIKNTPNGEVYGPTGRYNYLLKYSYKDIKELSINNIIEEIGLYNELENKEDFFQKYNEFIKRNRF